jgi:peptidoglycan/xylan/chitin deacetylase (PgdA/CDA1 family)
MFKKTLKKILFYRPLMNLVFGITNTLQFIINSIMVSSEENKGILTITFDDGLETVYLNAYPIMKKYGLRGNVAVVMDFIGTSGYMSIGQLRELHVAGWCICSHTMTHKNISTLDNEELEYELMESRKKLKELGFNGYHAFVVPYHYHNEYSMSKVKQIYDLSRNRSHKGMILFGRFGLYILPDLPLKKKHELPSLPIEDFYNVSNGRKKISKYIDHAVQKVSMELCILTD